MVPATRNDPRASGRHVECAYIVRVPQEKSLGVVLGCCGGLAGLDDRVSGSRYHQTLAVALRLARSDIRQGVDVGLTLGIYCAFELWG